MLAYQSLFPYVTLDALRYECLVFFAFNLDLLEIFVHYESDGMVLSVMVCVLH